MKDTPIIFLNGARQSGKSTLVKWLCQEKYPARYLTFDDSNVLAAASADPEGFISGIDGPVIIDEIQRVPELFLAIKKSVDQDRKPGRFILTGSANVLLLPKLADSLAGRMEILTLWPFSETEILETTTNFIQKIFHDDLPKSFQKLNRKHLISRLVTGGYPEAFDRKNDSRREQWFSSYVTTILQRDIRDIANIEGLTAMPRLLSLLATRAGSLLNYAELSRTSTIPQSTLKRYMTLLETTFLIKPLPAWSANLSKKLVKSPKVMLCDTGLSCYLTGADQQKLTEDPSTVGSILENFVCMELCKQISWTEKKYQLFHFRSATGDEVDFVIEDMAGNIAAIELKSRETIKSDDFKGIK
ncbi:ATP-binding protein, partial [bacterium]|nr:ATP-binding protein [bacterium]